TGRSVSLEGERDLLVRVVVELKVKAEVRGRGPFQLRESGGQADRALSWRLHREAQVETGRRAVRGLAVDGDRVGAGLSVGWNHHLDLEGRRGARRGGL